MLPILKKYYYLKNRGGFFYDEKSYRSNVIVPFKCFTPIVLLAVFINLTGLSMLLSQESIPEHYFHGLHLIHFFVSLLVYSLGGGLLKIYLSFKRNIEPSQADISSTALFLMAVMAFLAILASIHNILFGLMMLFDLGFIIFIVIFISTMNEKIKNNYFKENNNEKIETIQNEILKNPELAAQCYKETTCKDLKEQIIKEYFGEKKEEDIVFNIIKNTVENNIENT